MADLWQRLQRNASPPSDATEAERADYLRELRIGMTIVAAVMGVAMGLAIVAGAWGFAAAFYLQFEITAWLVSVEPTEHWLAEHRKHRKD